MPILFASSTVVLIIELALFGLLWLQDSMINLFIIAGHLITSVLTAYWFGQRWRAFLAPEKTYLFIASLIMLLPVIGSILLLLIENRGLLRVYGMKEGLGSEVLAPESARDLLNYFSAPNKYFQGNVRKTRDLLSSLDDEAYLGLLIASRHLSDKEAYALLTDALLSPFESARLMAYSLRGKLEDRIADSRQDKLGSLSSATTTKQKIELHLALSMEYLHVLDVGIESSDQASLVMQAKLHCIQALKLDQRSARAYQTLSKILRIQGDVKQAIAAERRAFTLASI